MAICILLLLLFQVAVLSFTSYKPNIPTTLSTRVVLPFSGFGEKREAPGAGFPGRRSQCAADHTAMVKAPLGITDF